MEGIRAWKTDHVNNYCSIFFILTDLDQISNVIQVFICEDYDNLATVILSSFTSTLTSITHFLDFPYPTFIK